MVIYSTLYSDLYGDPVDYSAGNAIIQAALVNAQITYESKITMLVNGIPVGDSNSEIEFIDGEVSMDRTSQSRRSFSAEIHGKQGDVISTHLLNYGSLLGMEFVVEVILDNVVRSVGVFVPDVVDHLNDDSAYVISVEANDRSTHVATASRSSRYVIAKGTPGNQAFQDYILDRYPGAALKMDVVTDETPSLTFGLDEDPWTGANRLAASFGCETYFDEYGQCVLAQIQDPHSAPIDFEYDDDQSDWTKLPFIGGPVINKINVREIYNGVIVQAEAPWLLFPVCASKWDTDPASPTYYDPNDPGASIVGPHPKVIRDSVVGTAAAAQRLADNEFMDIMGGSSPVEFEAMPHPLMFPGAVLMMNSRAGVVNGRVVVDRISLPLSVGDMQIQGRRITS